MQPISKGIATWLGIIVSVGSLLPPLVTQLIALLENTATQWTTAEKASLITGAAVAGITLLGRFAQAVAQVLKGG